MNWRKWLYALNPPIAQYADMRDAQVRVLRRAIDEVLAGDVTFTQERILTEALLTADSYQDTKPEGGVT